ncbi:Inositol monophosphatase-like [Dillenia turbinata]|uniref:Inositol monophosphatase-like n=1 Tax=Dillenia turbinata TaxID=194707 RepID=A0AAN8VRB9_9MAGN
MSFSINASRFSATRPLHRHGSLIFPRQPSRVFIVRSSLPFPSEKAKYYRELEAAVVERACCLCVDVKKTLFSSDGRVLEKNDQTPVTVADFGVQAFVSLELSRLFPSIRLVAEEDSTFLCSNNLADPVVNAVNDKTNSGDTPLTLATIMEAIDRGKDACDFETKPATYWVLDPIDGTRGFLKGTEALYVIGLALVVEGEIVLGVMGCPNWQENISRKPPIGVVGHDRSLYGSGIIVVAHAGCGTWRKQLPNVDGQTSNPYRWIRCFVDVCSQVFKARFCIPESQSWDSLPLSAIFSATTNADSLGDKQILLVPKCCGSLCKYLMVATGRASVYVQARTLTIIKIWDHAAGMICVEEAGGKVTDWKGSQLDLAADHAEWRVIFPSGGILVTNGFLHDPILEMIASTSSALSLVQGKVTHIPKDLFGTDHITSKHPTLVN